MSERLPQIFLTTPTYAQEAKNLSAHQVEIPFPPRTQISLAVIGELADKYGSCEIIVTSPEINVLPTRKDISDNEIPVQLIIMNNVF